MRILAFIALALFSSQACPYADKDVEGYSERYQSCSVKAEGSYTYILACQGKELAVQDARLNEAYSTIMRRLAPAERSILRTSERHWLRLKDKKCALPRDKSGLSGLVDSRECRLDETLRRTLWLKRYR